MKSNKNTSDKPFKAIIGIDLGDTKHAICVTDKRGTIRKEYSIANTRRQFEKLAATYPKALIALEVGTHSPWISRLLKELGLKVIVANARKLRLIYKNERKCDMLDARMLAKIVRLDQDLLYPIQHSSEDTQVDFIPIKMRDTLVSQRVNCINAIRGTLKALGIRIPSATTLIFATRARVYLEQNHPELLPSISPSLDVLDEIKIQIKVLDKAIDKLINEKYAAARIVKQIGGVGPITALAFVLTIERSERFEDTRDVGAYLGLVPKRDQSGETDKQLRISKTGNNYLRKLLVQCAQYNLGHFGQDSDLRRYGENIYKSRGSRIAKRKAVIAVARKLSVLMLTLWQRECDYEPLKNAKKRAA